MLIMTELLLNLLKPDLNATYTGEINFSSQYGSGCWDQIMIILDNAPSFRSGTINGKPYFMLNVSESKVQVRHLPHNYDIMDPSFNPEDLAEEIKMEIKGVVDRLHSRRELN